MRNRLAACVATTLLLVGAQPLHAGEIIYSFSGLATGSVGANALVDTPITIEVHGDAEGVTDFGSGIYASNPAPTTIEVQGVGSGSFAGNKRVFVHQSLQTVSLTDTVFLLAVSAAAFQSYDLGSAFPATNFGSISTPNFSASSDLGAVELSRIDSLVFEVTLPEPAGLGPVAVLSLALQAARRRRAKFSS